MDAHSPNPASYNQTLLGTIDRRFLQSRLARQVLLAILAAALVIPSVQFVIKINKTDASQFREGGERQRTALGRWMPSAALVFGDYVETDPYGFGHWFPLPPLVLMSLAPLSAIGLTAAAIVWVMLKLAGILAAIWAMLRSMASRDFAVPVGVMVMAFIFGLRPLISDIQHGNVNIFMMVWVALAWAAFVHGRDMTAGLFLALAIVTKVTPGMLLVYFLYKRQWRVCLSAGAGLILFFGVLPGLWFGFAESWTLHWSWFDMLIRPYLVSGFVTIEPMNQSLYGVLLRVGESIGVVELSYMPIQDALAAGMDNMARPVGAALLRPGLTVCVLGTMAWLCRAPTGRAGVERAMHAKDRRSIRLALEFALVLVAMLLLGERTWKHHATTLVIIFLIMWQVVACMPWSDRFRAVLAGGLFAQWILLTATSEGFLGNRLADRALYSGAFCWGLVLCFLEIAVVLYYLEKARRSREPTDPTRGEPQAQAIAVPRTGSVTGSAAFVFAARTQGFWFRTALKGPNNIAQGAALGTSRVSTIEP